MTIFLFLYIINLEKEKAGDNVEDRTLGIIYALKLGKYAADENIRMFLNEWSASNWNYFSRNDIDRVLRQTIADYAAQNSYY